MPTKGQILTNHATGDTFEFLATARDTGGEYVSITASVSRKGKSLPDHYHTMQDETFEVLSGQLTICKDGTTHILHAGEKMLLEKGIPHNHFNDSDEVVVYRHTVKPALDFDYLIENLVGLMGDSKRKDGKLGLTQQLVTLKYIDSKSFLADLPLGVQKLLMNTVAPVGRLLGYRAVYKKYSEVEK